MNVNKELCMLCQTCAAVCPSGAIEVTEMDIILTKCTPCGLCARACPMGALYE